MSQGAARKAGLRFGGAYYELDELPRYLFSVRGTHSEAGKLGAVALGVWLTLLRLRAKHGNPVFPGMKTLQRMAGGAKAGGHERKPVLPERTVQRALAKLERAGFIANGQQQWYAAKRLGAPAAQTNVRVMPRFVYGEARPTEDKGALIVELTPEMNEGLDAIGTWGGRRWAGRHLDHQDGTLLSPPARGQVGTHQGSRRHPGEGQDGTLPPVKTAPSPSVAEHPASPATIEPTIPAASTCADGQDGTLQTGAEGVKSAPIVEVVAAQKELPEAGTALANALDGFAVDAVFSAQEPAGKSTAEAPRRAQERRSSAGSGQSLVARLLSAGPGMPWRPHDPFAWGHEGLPMHPTGDVFTYTLPGVPRVPAALDGDRQAQMEWCAKWYRSAVESRLGRCPPVRVAGATKGYFEDALEVFVKSEIRPGAWVAWALDRILEKLPTNARKRFMPQVKTLLSPKTLSEFRWAFYEKEADWATQAVVRTDAGDELQRRMKLVEAEVLVMRAPRDPVVVGRALARHFPEGWVAAVRAARERNEAQGQEVLTRIKLGHWLWGRPKWLEGSNGRSAA